MNDINQEFRKRLLLLDMPCSTTLQPHDRGYEVIVECDRAIADAIYQRRLSISRLAWSFGIWYILLVHQGQIVNGFSTELALRANSARQQQM